MGNSQRTETAIRELLDKADCQQEPCSPSSARKYKNRGGEIWEWDGQKWRELFSSDAIQRLGYYERKIASMDDDRNELRAIAKEALGSFRCTQRPEIYPEGHWSRRAQILLENAGGMARELAAQKPESTTEIDG